MQSVNTNPSPAHGFFTGSGSQVEPILRSGWAGWMGYAKLFEEPYKYMFTFCYECKEMSIATHMYLGKLLPSNSNFEMTLKSYPLLA